MSDESGINGVLTKDEAKDHPPKFAGCLCHVDPQPAI
jgi:hypothetical protein